MRVVLCAIAKKEHIYINDWVNHYLKIGFDNIFIFDNDDLGTEYIGHFINVKNSPRVKIINARGLKIPHLQHYVYNKFYHEFFFDWVFFCDIDEYLVGIDNVKEFLSQSKFNKYPQIRIKWRLFGDDEVIERDIKVSPLEFFHNVIEDNPLSNQGKSFIRGGLPIIINSCHFNKKLRSCYPSGRECQHEQMDLLDYQEEVFVNHYMTKTLDEFIKQKLDRGDAVWEKRKIDFSYFFNINKKTEEKINYLKSKGFNIE